jgi:hypothetical protein
MVFTSDFNLQSFGNVLSLTKPLLSVVEIVAGLANKNVVTNSLNTSSLNVDGLTSLDLVSISLGLNSTNNNLFNINCSGTANFSSLNAEFINSSNVVNVSEIIGADCDFGSGYIQSFKSELINASNMNLSNELNTSVVNASQINASNIVGYQETLVAGSNISIAGNILSSTADANFSTVNSSNLNALILFVEGFVSIGGIITSPNQIGVLAYSKSGDTVSGTKLPYDETQYNIGGHYNPSTYVFTCPVVGRYSVYGSYSTINNEFAAVVLILYDGSTERIIAKSQEGGFLPGNNAKRDLSVIINCSVGDELYARMDFGQVKLRNNNTTNDEIFNPFVVQFLG